MADAPVTLAAVTGAHGVAGEVRLKLLGEGLASLSPGTAFNGGTLTLAKICSDGKGGAIARFAEIADRTAAEGLRGTALSVPRRALPPLAEGYWSPILEDKFYQDGLHGGKDARLALSGYGYRWFSRSLS